MNVEAHERGPAPRPVDDAHVADPRLDGPRAPQLACPRALGGPVDWNEIDDLWWLLLDHLSSHLQNGRCCAAAVGERAIAELRQEAVQ